MFSKEVFNISQPTYDFLYIIIFKLTNAKIEYLKDVVELNLIPSELPFDSLIYHKLFCIESLNLAGDATRG